MLCALCLTAALLCPIGASAEPWSFAGTLAIGATDLDGGTGIASLDGTATVPLNTRLHLNVEIGTYLFTLEAKRPHETYAALVLDDRWRIGAVRPAYDAVLPSVFSRAAPFLAYGRAEYTRAHATIEAMRNTAVPWGVSWQHSVGQTTLELSAHDAVKGKFRTLSASLAHHREGWSLAAALEPVWLRDGTYLGTNAKLGGRADLGTGSAGLAMLHPVANDRPDAFSFDVVMPLSAKLDGLAFGEFTQDHRDNAYGLALDYDLRPNSTVLFAATDGALGRALHLTLEHRF
jgi:hypothetical protein